MSSLTPRLDAIQSQAQNLIINGNMDFQQRGNAVTTNTTYNYGIDRFAWYRNSININTPTLTRDTDIPTLSESGWQGRYSYKLVTNAGAASPGAGELYHISHKIEGLDYQAIHGRPARFQFWIKSTLAGSFSVVFTNAALPGSQTRSYVAPYTISNANTWQKVVIDLTMDTGGTWNFDNTCGLHIQWPLCVTNDAKTTSSTNQWLTGQFNAATGQTNFAGTASQSLWLTQVSLIPGEFDSNIDLPFRRAGKDIQQELAMCQRYYYHVGGEATNAPLGMASIHGGGAYNNNTSLIAYIGFPVTMRGTPAFSQVGTFQYATQGGGSFGGQTFSGSTLCTTGARLNATVAANGGGASIILQDSSDNDLRFNAEL